MGMPLSGFVLYHVGEYHNRRKEKSRVFCLSLLSLGEKMIDTGQRVGRQWLDEQRRQRRVDDRARMRIDVTVHVRFEVTEADIVEGGGRVEIVIEQQRVQIRIAAPTGGEIEGIEIGLPLLLIGNDRLREDGGRSRRQRRGWCWWWWHGWLYLWLLIVLLEFLRCSPSGRRFVGGLLRWTCFGIGP